MTLQYNIDGAGLEKVLLALSLASRHNADVVCLQEVSKVKWNKNLVADLGWLTYVQESDQPQVAIFLRTSTAERMALATDEKDQELAYVWSSDNYNSMAVTLDTPHGSLMIGNAYIPTGVDDLPERRRATQKDPRYHICGQHSEVLSRAALHTHSVLMID